MSLRDDAWTFTEEYLLWSGRSESTRRSYRSHLSCFADYLEDSKNGQAYTDEVTLQDIEGYLLYLRTGRGLSPKSIGNHVACLKSFFKYAQRSGMTGDNPASLVTTPKSSRRLPVFLDPEEVERLVNEIERPPVRVAALTMYYTGLRVGEVTNLTLDDVDLGRGQLIVRSGKGDKDRVVPLGDKIREILRRYLEYERPDLGNRIFFPAKKGRLCTNYVTRVIGNAAIRCGIGKNVSSHTLRHSFATNLYRRGVGLKEIGSLLGHANLMATEIYTHLGNEDLAKAVNLL